MNWRDIFALSVNRNDGARKEEERCRLVILALYLALIRSFTHCTIISAKSEVKDSKENSKSGDGSKKAKKKAAVVKKSGEQKTYNLDGISAADSGLKIVTWNVRLLFKTLSSIDQSIRIYLKE